MTDRLHEDIVAVTVPKWGLSMEDGAIVEWHVAEGDLVKDGQDLLDIETSKITNTVESSASGVFRRLVEEAGSHVYVGQLIGVIAPESVSSELIDEYVETFQKQYVPPDAREIEESNAKFLETDQYRIHYLSIENPESQHRPVILIHGFGGDCNNWMFNLVELGKTLPVFAPDLPGHGASGKSLESGSLAELATAVLAFIDALHLATVDLVGHSLGAAVAMQIAETQPHRVASLALIAPAGLGAEINNTYIREFIDGKNRRELKNTLGLLFADKTLVSRDMVNDVLKYKRIDGVTEALTQIADSNFPDGKQRHSFRHALDSGVAVPTLIVWGDQDEVADPDHSRGLGENIEVELIDGSGHMPHMEAANQVNGILLSHLLTEKHT